jgi:hypothetical protein
VLQTCAAAGATCPGVGGACQNGSCGACGAVGQACCQDPMTMRGVCTGAGASCQNGQCVACGGGGQPCCAGRSCTAQNVVCSMELCVACGGNGQPCCAGAGCSPGLACGDGVCGQCGGPGQACCPGAMCAAGCCDPGPRTCVANGTVCSTGGMCANGTCPMATNGCGNGQMFPMFDKGCTNTDSCVFGMHQISCCGSQEAIGFNHAQLAAFTAAEAAWEATCGACGCPAALPLAEDGKMCMQANITVSCDNGRCTTTCN